MKPRWAAVVVLLAGCPRRDAAPTSPPPPTVAGPRGSVPDDGMHHTERLAVASWRPDGTFQACGSRGSCLMVERAGAPAAAVQKPLEGFARDASAVDHAPGGCRVRLDDAPGDPGAPPARAVLIGPRGVAPLAEWRPEKTVDGDYFAIETSFSPDGERVAIVEVAVGLGVDERRVDVIDVQLRPTPTCK